MTEGFYKDSNGEVHYIDPSNELVHPFDADDDYFFASQEILERQLDQSQNEFKYQYGVKPYWDTTGEV